MKRDTIVKSKYYLYATEFFAGMSVMAVELGASRLLAPYFSSSQIVWTIIIGTIMIAMALGNIWGGRRADKNPNPDRLYLRIIFAAVWIAAIPVVGKYIILAISGVLILSVNTYFLAWASFLACMTIFVFPLFLLGTVTPSLAKYTISNLEDNGKIIGTLGAYNTIGSILGTFLPTFVTIPAVGTSITFLVFSGILLLIGLVYFISNGRKFKTVCLSILLFIVFCFLGNSNSFAFWENNLLYEGESVYNYLQVKESDDSIILSTNVLFGVQSIMKKDNTLTGMYYDYAMAAPLMADIDETKKGNLLVLGMGTGTYATQCKKYFKGLEIDGVEIDNKITNLANQYFELSDEIDVSTYDGRAYLSATNQKYDVIMVDAYQDITIPFQMSSYEFFTMVKEHLNDNGVMVVNMNMHSDKEGNINDYLSDTIANVFNRVYTVDVDGSTNRELFAMQDEDALELFDQNKDKIEDSSLQALMNRVSEDIISYDRGDYLLTDDKAPVEMLGMQVIDDLIKGEVSYYKEIYREEGIQGILQSF